MTTSQKTETIALYKTSCKTLSSLFESKDIGQMSVNLFEDEEIEFAGYFCKECWKKGVVQDMDNGQKCPTHS